MSSTSGSRAELHLQSGNSESRMRSSRPDPHRPTRHHPSLLPIAWPQKFQEPASPWLHVNKKAQGPFTLASHRMSIALPELCAQSGSSNSFELILLRAARLQRSGRCNRQVLEDPLRPKDRPIPWAFLPWPPWSPSASCRNIIPHPTKR